jgi:hypothetical protein
MDTIVDIQEVQAQLDKAARDATNGSPDIRAGRFVHEDAMAKPEAGDQLCGTAERRITLR